VIAAAILAAFAFRGFSQKPAQLPASKPDAQHCTPEAIKQVADALERSVLSANCAKQARDQSPRN
jgi:entry exclusion lipoprotein TrbK